MPKSEVCQRTEKSVMMPEKQESNTWEAIQAVWTKRLFTASFVLLGVMFLLQGVGVLRFPEMEQSKQKPIRAGGLQCIEPVWNFGTVDSVVRPRLFHEFVLINESKETVSIKQVHSSCGCMVAEGYDEELGPGQSTRLRVEVELPPLPQRFHKDLAVQTNKGVLPLSVVGEIVANSALHSIPAEVNFGIMLPGEKKERIVKIYRYDLSPVVIETVSSSQDGICVESLEGRVHNEMKLKVQFTSQGKDQAENDNWIFVRTRHENNVEIRIPIIVRVKETYEFVP